MTKPEQHNAELLDALIKQALQQEYASVDAPPPEALWEKIKARLEETAATRPARARSRRTFSWSRLAAVAAACLVILVGGIALVQMKHPFHTGRQELVGAEPAGQDEVKILTEEDGAPAGLGPGDIPPAPDGEAYRAEDARSYGTWPVALGQSYTLKGVGAALEPPRLAAADHAVYVDPDTGHVLLYISLAPACADRARLPEELTALVGAPVALLEEDAAAVAFLAENGSLVLGWEAGERMMFLVDPDGRLSLEQLREIRRSLL